MNRGSRLVWLTLLFLVLLLAALAVQAMARPRLPAYDPASREAGGLLLLREWLVEMGYEVSVTDRDGFDPGDADLLFVYPGRTGFTTAERNLLVDWVEGGGSAVLVDIRDETLSEHFDFDRGRSVGTQRLRQVQPLLPQASTVITSTWTPRRLDLPDNQPWLTLVAEQGTTGRGAVAVRRMGQGWVWLLSRDFELTNDRLLLERATAQIVPALLRGVPAGGHVRFDTFHLRDPSTQSSEAIGSVRDWLYRTPAGWATLLFFVLGFAYLLLQGRRLGPAIPVVAQGRRREAAEFVVAMAGLQRRARLTGSIARQQKHRLKQRLGRAWDLPGDLPDDEFVTRLAALDTTLDAERLRRTLGRLSETTDEATLVSTIQEIDGDPQWTSRI